MPSAISKIAEKLANCPFCDSASVDISFNDDFWPVVECDDCGARGPVIKMDREGAITLWNTRAGILKEHEAGE